MRKCIVSDNNNAFMTMTRYWNNNQTPQSSLETQDLMISVLVTLSCVILTE